MDSQLTTPLCFDLSSMSKEEVDRINHLKKTLNLKSIEEAFGLELAIVGLIRDPTIQEECPPPKYENFAPQITGEKRELLLQYIEKTRESRRYN